MPLIPDTKPAFGFAPVALPDQYGATPEEGQPGEAPSLGETFGAAGRLENEVVGAIRQMDHDSNFGTFDAEHNPWDTIRGTELETYHDAFVGSRNAKETSHIAARIREEIEDRKILERANPAIAFGAMAAASMASPTVLLPGGAIYRGLKVGQAALKGAATVGAANAVAAGVQEGILHSQQYTRTGLESGFAVGGSFVLGAILGGAASGFSSAKFANLTKKLEVDLNIGPRIDEAIGARMKPGQGQEAGAAAAQGPAADLAPAFGLEKTIVKVDPVGRTMNAASPTAREVETMLAELPLQLTRNADGISTAPRGGSVETRIKTQGTAREIEALQGVHSAYAEYRFGDPNAKLTGFKALTRPDSTKLQEKAFHQEVGKAMARGDVHDNPFVARAAAHVRKTLIDPIADAAVKYKLLDADVVKKNRPKPAATVSDAPAKGPEDGSNGAAAPVNAFARSTMDGLLSRVEDLTGQKIDPGARSGVLDAISRDETLANRLREIASGQADVPFALRGDAPVGRTIDDMVASLEAGHPVALDRDAVEAVEAIVRDVRLSLPPAAKDVPVHVMLGAEPTVDGYVGLTFRILDGGIRRIEIPLKSFAGARAFMVDGGVFVVRADFRSDAVQIIDGEVRHELVHALHARGLIDQAVFGRLAGHAESLRVLDMSVRDYARAIGDPDADLSELGSLRSLYHRIYQPTKAKDKALFDDIMRQEAVAHMVELRHHGGLVDTQLAPVIDDMNALFGKPVPAGEAHRQVVAQWARDLDDGQPLFALSGRQDGNRDVDALGYYSRALRAARSLPQERGTPEQMLEMLKKAGARKAEIEATGLDKFLAEKAGSRESDAAAGSGAVTETPSSGDRTSGQSGSGGRLKQPSITKAEIIKFLEEQRVGLREVERRSDRGVPLDMEALDNVARMYYDEPYAELSPDRQIRLRQELGMEDRSETKWSAHSLDPNSETYGETVLHLPENKSDTITGLSGDALTNALAQRRFGRDWASLSEREQNVAMNSNVDDFEAQNFQAGHFPEPNTVGHYQHSLVKHEGKPVYNLDQVQSDWGQRIRDDSRDALGHKLFGNRFKDLTGEQRKAVSAEMSAMAKRGEKPAGVKDEVKIAQLRAAISNAEKLPQQFEAIISGMSGGRKRFDTREAAHEWALSQLPDIPGKGVFGKPTRLQITRDMPLVNGATTDFARHPNGTEIRVQMVPSPELVRLNAELRTAEASAPGHPLVNTTDQWTNTTLRHALKSAIESDAKFIAIPHGDTVLSYNPGDKHGMNTFYNNILPKNMTSILRKLDKDAPASFRVPQVETPSGMKGKGFTLFEITDKVREEIGETGQPLFALRDLGRRLDAKLVDDIKKGDPSPQRVIAVHGTKASFETFDPAKSADIGVHFGSNAQADIPAGFTTTRDNARMIPAVLDLKKVVDVPDLMTWPPAELAKALEKSDPTLFGIEKRIRAMIDAGPMETGMTGKPRPTLNNLKAAKAELRRLLSDAKVDGLRYWNEAEGEGWSYIVWDKGRATSALTGEPLFSARGDDVLKRIRALGGIKDEGGDLRAMGVGDDTRGIINNADGMSPDKMREALAQEGYLFEPEDGNALTSVQDLYDLISGAMTSPKEARVYREEMAHQVMRSAQKMFEDGTGVRLELTPDQEGALVDYVLDGGLSVDDALERVGMAGAAKAEAPKQQRTNVARDVEAIRFMNDMDARAREAGYGGDGDVFNPAIADEVWGDGDQTYITRLYQREHIIKQRPAFKGILTDYFEDAQQRARMVLSRLEREIGAAEAKAARDGKTVKIDKDAAKNIEDLRLFTGLSRQDLGATADGVINHILGSAEGRMLYDLPAAVRGPLKARTLRIPDAFKSAHGVFEDFLDRDISTIARYYTRTMVPDIEITRMFGSLDLKDQIAKINDDYGRMMESPDLVKMPVAHAENIRKKLAKQQGRVTKDLFAQVDRVRGVYGLPDDPTAFGPRTARAVKQFNLLRMLGGMTISAIPDIFRPMMVHGVSSYFIDGIRPLLTSIKAVKLAAEEVQLAGTAGDLFLSTRMRAAADIMDDYGRLSKTERGLGYMADRFGNLTLMNQWNTGLKSWAGMITMNNILKASRRVVDGTASKSDITKLAASGIDSFDARLIVEQFNKHGVVEGGVYLPNSKAWDVSNPNVQLAIEVFRGAIVRDVDRIVVTPGLDKPLWMSTQMGSVFGQFKSFGFATMQRTLVAGLQQRDAGVMMGMMFSAGAGMMVEYFKSLSNDKPLPETEAQWIAAGIDRSGVLGWLSDANHIVEKFSGGTVGASALAGKPLSRFASRNVVDAFAGPSAGTLTDLAIASSGFARAIAGADDLREGDVAALRRMIPLQNLFYLSYIFQKLEQSAAQSLGVRPSSRSSDLRDRLSQTEGVLDQFSSA